MGGAPHYAYVRHFRASGMDSSQSRTFNAAHTGVFVRMAVTPTPPRCWLRQLEKTDRFPGQFSVAMSKVAELSTIANIFTSAPLRKVMSRTPRVAPPLAKSSTRRQIDEAVQDHTGP
jgi:hypothetical protein